MTDVRRLENVSVFEIAIPYSAFCESHPLFSTPQELADELTHRFRFSVPVVAVCRKKIVMLYVVSMRVPQEAVECELKRVLNSY